MTIQVHFVIPTLGERLEWLGLAIESIRAQSVNVLITVVSPYKSKELERLCEKSGASILYETSKKGLASAVNLGWKHGSSRYIAWLGDDDLLEPDTLAKVLAKLDKSGAAMIYGGCKVINSSGELTHLIKSGNYAKYLMHWGPDLVPQPGSIFRRDSVAKVGNLNENLKYAMDLDLFLRLSKIGKIIYFRGYVASFRRHPTSLTVSNPEGGLEAKSVRGKHSQIKNLTLINSLEKVGRIFGIGINKFAQFKVKYGSRLPK